MKGSLGFTYLNDWFSDICLAASRSAFHMQANAASAIAAPAQVRFVRTPAIELEPTLRPARMSAMRAAPAAIEYPYHRRVWVAPALQAIFVIATFCQYSRVSGLFAWRLPLAMMSSASKVPIG